MRYENELIELMPMLKSYLKKISLKFHNDNIDTDDIFQECIYNIIKSGNKPLEKPRNYFIGICDKTIKSLYKRNYRETMNMDKVRSEFNFEESEENKYEGGTIIERLNQRIECNEKKTVQGIWYALKRFNGNINKASEYLKCHPQTVFYHKRKLKKLYQEI